MYKFCEIPPVAKHWYSAVSHLTNELTFLQNVRRWINETFNLEKLQKCSDDAGKLLRGMIIR